MYTLAALWVCVGPWPGEATDMRRVLEFSAVLPPHLLQYSITMTSQALSICYAGLGGVHPGRASDDVRGT